MTITIQRIDFSTTVNTLITICARHAYLLDGQPQRSLDDITTRLHEIDAIIARQNLADRLNGPIPPLAAIYAPPQDDDDDPSEPEASAPAPIRTGSASAPAPSEPEALAPAPSEPEASAPAPSEPGQRQRPQQTGSAPAPHVPGLNAGETIVLDYIRANPGCTADEIAAAVGYTRGTLMQMLGDIRKTTTIISTGGGRSGPAHYTAQ